MIIIIALYVVIYRNDVDRYLRHVGPQWLWNKKNRQRITTKCVQ